MRTQVSTACRARARRRRWVSGLAVVALFVALLGTVSTATTSHTAVAHAAGSYGADDYPDQDAVDCSGKYGVYSWCKGGSDLSSRGFGYRNCTDFAAYRIGIAWGSLAFPSGDGNARGWKQGAINSGYQVGSTPAVGAVAWWGTEVGGGFGHVAVVMSVNSDNSSNVEQYNKAGTGTYSQSSHVIPDAYLYIGVSPPGSGGTPSASVSNDNGQMVVQLANFPLGTTYFFCHTGSAADYPAGGAVPNRGSVAVTSPNQSWSSGWCSGSGNFWVGVQAANGQDYYSNQVTLGPPPTVPGPPTGATATPGNASATVTWSRPSNDGGAAITGYRVTASSGGGECSTNGDLSCTVSSLANGSAYTFSVTASNGVGSGPASDPSSPIIPATVPDAPTAVSANPHAGQVTVSWVAPQSNGSAISQYTVTASPGGTTATTDSTSATVTALTNGTAYTFTVTATNSVGTGPASGPSNSVTPQATPLCGIPGPPKHGFYTPSGLSTDATPTVPSATTWTAASGNACTYQLQRQDATTGAWTPLYTGPARSFRSRENFGILEAFRTRSIDAAGTPSSWAMAIMTTLDGFQQDSATYTGTYTVTSGPSLWGGTATSSKSAGASASRTFSGQSLAIIGTKCPSCGAFRLYIDGVLMWTPTEYSSVTQYRQVVAQWAGVPGDHLVKIVNVGTAGHPAVIIDGFAAFR